MLFANYWARDASFEGLKQFFDEANHAIELAYGRYAWRRMFKVSGCGKPFRR